MSKQLFNKPQDIKYTSRQKWVNYAMVVFLVLWPVAVALLDLGSKLRCLSYTNGNCSADTLSRIVQLIPLWLACFTIGYNLITPYQKNTTARVVISLLLSVAFSYIAFHWYVGVLFGLSPR